MKKFKFNIQLFAETIKGTEGHDKITVSSSERIVYGYGGNDTIFNNYNNNITIIAGAGNDSIRNYNGASNISIKADEGNDIIENYYGNNVYMNGGAGDDVFYNISTRYGSGANATIIGGDGIDKINHSGLNGVITGDKGNDSITHDGNYGSIDGGEGDDYIYSSEGINVSITGGAGNDKIYSKGNQNGWIVGGVGNDFISAWGNTENLTINGGADADTVSLTTSVSAVIEYTSGDGDDYIYGFNEDDTLKISGSYSTTTSGNNVIVQVGSGKITLDGAAGKSLNIVSSGVTVEPEAEYIFNKKANSLVAGGSGADTIFNTGRNSTLNGNAGDDYIFNLATNVTINGGAGNDTINATTGKVTINGGTGNDEIILYGGSILYQYATGDGYDTIAGFGANDTLHITSGTISKSTVSGSDVILTIGSGNITLKDAKGKNIKIKNSSDTLISTIFSGGSDTQPPAQSTLISNSANSTVINGTGSADSIYNSGSRVTIQSGGGNDTIYNNNGDYSSIDAGTGNNVISLSSGSNSNTIKAGAGYDTVYNFISSSGYNVINAENAALNSISIINNDAVFYFNGGSTRIKNAANQNIQFANSYIDGKINLQTGYTTLNINNTSKYYWATGTNATVSLGSSAPTYSNINLNNANFNDKNNLGFYGDIKAIDAGNFSGNATLTGNAKDNIIKGGYGHNVISGDKGNDTISLSGGSNFVNYNSGDGNDIIYGVNSSDTLKITGAKYSTLQSGSDLKVSVGSSEILIKNGANISFTINGTLDGGLATGLSIKNSVLTASSSFSGNTIDLSNYSKVTKVNATKVSQAVSILGTTAANSLKGGNGSDYISAGDGNDTVYGGNGYDILYGGAGNDLLKGEAGNDTLSGGAGNDTLTGGAGNDVFIYSAGNDLITDYASGDIIQIDGTISNSYYSGKNVIFEIGSGSLTVKNGKGKYIFVTDSSGTKTYSRTLDILYDNNFMTDENNLDSITEQKYSVTEIQNYNAETFAQDSSILAYSEDK